MQGTCWWATAAQTTPPQTSKPPAKAPDAQVAGTEPFTSQNNTPAQTSQVVKVKWQTAKEF
jgi:hypothetical protein